MNTALLRGSLNPKNIIDLFLYKIKFNNDNPFYFEPEGHLVFCGSQGSGKTLSAVQYIQKILEFYPSVVFCTNVNIADFPINCYYKSRQDGDTHHVYYYSILGNKLVKYVSTSTDSNGDVHCVVKNYNVEGFDFPVVVEYDGLNCIKELENSTHGVVYLIDEIHLEFNSLESQNIPIDIMVEVSQQRKQRKHIVGTSQVYMRLAKPFREQIKYVVICKKLLGFFQLNRLVDGSSSYEENGKLHFETEKRVFWLHTLKLYNSYNTYQKMRRYRNEWKGVSSQDIYRKEDVSYVIQN